MKIRQQLVTGENRRVSKGTNPCTTVTIHQTGNTSRGANAKAHGNLLARGGMAKNSWHATVDDTEAVISYENSARCWHAANATGNNTSYSIEICVNSDGDYLATIRNAAEFTAGKLRELGLTTAALVQHNRWSKKNCPEQIRAGKDGIDWDDFVALVNQHLHGPVAVPTPTPAPALVQPATPAPAPATKPTYAELVVDGVLGPVTVRAFQTLMARIDRYSGLIDGSWGRMTSTAGQSWLASLGHYTGRIDGDWGDMSRRALQRFLASKGLDVGPADGVQGPRTIRALQTYLNQQRRHL